MTTERLNTIIYRTVGIAMCGFLLLVSIGMILTHYYLRAAIGFTFALIIGFRVRNAASLKAWVITVVLFIVAVALVDLDPVEKSNRETSVVPYCSHINC